MKISQYEMNNIPHNHADEIDEIMDSEKTFKENVLDFRKRTTGSSDGIMNFYTIKE